MNTFQRIILTILTVVGLTTPVSPAIIGSNSIIPNTYTTHGTIPIFEIEKTGTGTTTLQNSLNIESVKIDAGTLVVDETTDLGAAQVNFFGGTLEVAGNINTGELRLDVDGTLKVDAACTAVLSEDTTGDNILTKTGLGTLLVANDRSNSSAPMTVSAGTLDVGSSGVLPTATLNVGSTGTLLLERSTASTAPGATSINSGGTLKTTVAIGVANTFSGGVTFHSGAVLDLGGDWAQNITVAP